MKNNFPAAGGATVVRGLIGGLAAIIAGLTAMPAAEIPEPGPGRETITDPAWIWAMPGEQKNQVHPLKLEGRVSYYDPGFNILWLEKNNLGTYVQLATPAPEMSTGQRVLLEGTIIPAQGLSADRVKVTVLRDQEPIEPLNAKGRINDLVTLHGRIVTAEAYVDDQQLIDGQHDRLTLVIENRPVIGWIKPDNPAAMPNWKGSFVRVQALYSGRFDPTQTRTSIELWMSRQSDLQVLGSIADHPAFQISPTPIKEIHRARPGTQVRVRGRVEAHEAGEWMIIRDATGQVMVHSIQQRRMPVGADIEAVGEVTSTGARWTLERALYRAVPSAGDQLGVSSGGAILRTVEQIRQLSGGETARGQPVNLSGLVTWSLAGNDFFFLQDISGGIRVHYDRAKMDPPPLGKYIQVKGSTYNERQAPAVELKAFKDLGSMSPPIARPVTFDQAITGREDGQWVEMRGFIQRTESEGDWRWIHVTSPEGEFVGHLQSPVNFVANPGSLIRVHGVCETSTDQGGKITGLTLRVPFLHDITIEEDAPVDFYDLPVQSIQSLNQLSVGQNMTRVRIVGVVLHARGDGSLYVQQEGAALLVFSHEKRLLAPGDQIEAVGILGREGVRTVLREAVYRKTGRGPPPVPTKLGDLAPPTPADDSRLVQVRGTLIDKFDRPGRTRLTLQAGNVLFEAMLERPANAAPPDYALGTGLELTGIYRLEFDDARRVRGFQLQLRSPDDVAVFQPPRLWTLQRALLVTALLAGCTLLGLGWITALRRRVSRQTEQIRQQLERQNRLEIEVQRAARLESLGVLAGGIAHDFNNALTSIMGYTSIALLDQKAVALVGDCLLEIEKGTRRARNLTQQLLTFAQGGDPVRTSVALPDLIREALTLVLHGTNVRCGSEVSPGLWPINADGAQIAQVIQNLMRNALQAMPRGGEIRLVLANEEIAAGDKPGLAAGRYVRISMTDTGEGIPTGQLARIFEPYFSIRKAGRGLGLATVHSIVKKHEGLVEVQSAAGTGTTFQIWLPAAKTLAPLPSSTLAARTTPLPPRVLLMDDEESIRGMGLLALQRMGLDATTVADGDGAIREFTRARATGRPYDLVILDLTIRGGLGGKETVEQLKKIDPGILAIVSSGYSSDPVMANYRNYGFHASVPKPYDITLFMQTVEQLLESGRGIQPRP